MSNPLFDRSRLLQYQRCPRSYWYQYGIYGRGVVGTELSVPLEAGTGLHRGAELLLNGHPLDYSISCAIGEYIRRCKNRGLLLNATEDQQYVMAEQSALIEAILRVFSLVVLPDIKRCKVIEVEQEHILKLGGIDFMSRPDAVVQDGDEHYVLSFKTTGLADSDATRKKLEIETYHDDQGISEGLAFEQDSGIKIAGTKYIFLLKGQRREYPKGSGKWVQWSPLIQGYRKAGAGMQFEYAAEWKWKDEQGHGHTLGKGWERFNVWEGMGVKAWIQKLGEIAPELLLRQVFMPMAAYRNAVEVEDWKEQAKRQAEDITSEVGEMEQYRIIPLILPYVDSIYRTRLNDMFPQHRRSCDWPSRCAYQEICFGPVSEVDPLLSGDFVLREPHHAAEEKNGINK